MRIVSIRIQNLKNMFNSGSDCIITVEIPDVDGNRPFQIPCGKTVQVPYPKLTKLEVNMYPADEPDKGVKITFGVFRHEDGHVLLALRDQSPDWKPLSTGEIVDGEAQHGLVATLPNGSVGILVIGTVDDLTDPDPK